MPRSASTLQFNITWKLVEKANAGLRVDWRSSDDWKTAQLELLDMAESDKIHVVKMHFPPESVKQLAEESNKVKFVYVHRDVFDVVFSMKKKFKFSTARAIKRLRESLEVEAWLLKQNRDCVQFQEYEVLLNTLDVACSELMEFLSLELKTADILEISNELSLENAYDRSRRKTVRFEHLKRIFNRVLGRKIDFSDAELMLHPNHVSDHKGKMGIGREGLSEGEIQKVKKAFQARCNGMEHE
jgi:hypothetical protein